MATRNQGRLTPSRLSHFILRTTPDSFPAMVNWYKKVLQSDVVFENEAVCFMYYDDEHHRIGIGCGPGIGDRPLNCKGVDHIAFAYETVGDLVTTYERLVGEGITPSAPMHHGATLSMYYLDPDLNQVELLVDCFKTREEAHEYVRGAAFGENPIGVRYDADELARRYHDGVPEAELLRPIAGGPPPPGEWPVPH